MQNIFRIGTSGWSYSDPDKGSWNGIFYPPGIVDELRYYSQRFNTVEVNSTFYRSPAPEAIKTENNLTIVMAGLT